VRGRATWRGATAPLALPVSAPLRPLDSCEARSRKRKSWEEYSNRHKKRKIHECKEKVLDFSDSQFEVTAVHVRNKDTGCSDIVSATEVTQVNADPQQSTDLKKVLLAVWNFLPRIEHAQRQVENISYPRKLYWSTAVINREVFRKNSQSTEIIRQSHKVRVKMAHILLHLVSLCLMKVTALSHR
jgi:hypothetical protein